MSFGTSFIHETYFNRETFDTLDKVKTAIKEEKDYLDSIKDEILGYALMTEPNKMLKLDPDINPMEHITTKVKDLLNEYYASSNKLSELRDLEYEWDECHIKNDKGEIVAKSPKNYDDYPSLFGDFIKSDKSEELE